MINQPVECERIVLNNQIEDWSRGTCDWFSLIINTTIIGWLLERNCWNSRGFEMVTFPTMSMMNGLRGRDKGTVLLSFYSCSTRPNTFQSITFLPFFLSSPSSSLRFFLLFFFLFSYSLSLFLTFLFLLLLLLLLLFQWTQRAVPAQLLSAIL